VRIGVRIEGWGPSVLRMKRVLRIAYSVLRIAY
jgi:hypothetical protein